MTVPAGTFVPTDSLANRLVLIRRELGLSQREAAQRCGVGFGSWQSWENGSAPRNALRDLAWVAQRLNIDREWLMFGGALRPEAGPGRDDGLPRVDSNHQPADLQPEIPTVEMRAAFRKIIRTGTRVEAL